MRAGASPLRQLASSDGAMALAVLFMLLLAAYQIWIIVFFPIATKVSHAW